MSRITPGEVGRVADLARLSLGDEEAARIGADLEAILDYVETLAQVDTDGVAPTAHAIPLDTPLREDRADPPFPVELALANAPDPQGTAFGVPKVIEGEEEG